MHIKSRQNISAHTTWKPFKRNSCACPTYVPLGQNICPCLTQIPCKQNSSVCPTGIPCEQDSSCCLTWISCVQNISTCLYGVLARFLNFWDSGQPGFIRPLTTRIPCKNNSSNSSHYDTICGQYSPLSHMVS
jgi:hypothetical protein